LLALAACTLHAAGSTELVYKLHLPNPAARVEWTAPIPANWEVTVAVDTARCQLFCVYRIKRGTPSGVLLAPPTVVIRIYSDFVSIPQTVTVDPAGLTLPTAAGETDAPRDCPYMPGRKLFAAVPVRRAAGAPSTPPQPQHFSASHAGPATAAAVPLRI